MNEVEVIAQRRVANIVDVKIKHCCKNESEKKINEIQNLMLGMIVGLNNMATQFFAVPICQKPENDFCKDNSIIMSISFCFKDQKSMKNFFDTLNQII